MPSYRDTLMKDEMADLLAYLISLRDDYGTPNRGRGRGARMDDCVGPRSRAGDLRAPARCGERSAQLAHVLGGYSSNRHSPLDQITPANVKNLEQKWVLQGNVVGTWQATPLVVDGVMYVTERLNDVVALDAQSGRPYWIYRYNPPADQRACCGSNNRGVAVLGDLVYMGTLDAHLVAIDAKTGKKRWEVEVGDYNVSYSITLAPLAVKDKIIVGVGGAELGIRGFIAAYDAKTGTQAWKTYLIPGPGEPGHETWKGDAWKTGGASVWITGSYDPSLNLTYWGTGNPGPDWNPAQRPGDNLYSDSVVALDPDTGKMKWHFQFTPNDPYDYDAVQIPVLADITMSGTPTKAMLWANRNGFFYVLNRETGKFLLGKPFVKVNWASGIDANGRPIRNAARSRRACLSRCSGRHELVFAVLQSTNASAVRSHLGEQRSGHQAPGSAVRCGEAVHRWRVEHRDAGAERTRDTRAASRAVQYMDRGDWHRRRARDRPADGRTQVEVSDDRRHRQRCPDDGIGSGFHGWQGRLLPGARCAHGNVALEDEPRADRSSAARCHIR